jgi:ketosteroid isomerase-like protein
MLEAAVALPLLSGSAWARQAGGENAKETNMGKPSATVQKLLEEARVGGQAWMNGKADYAEMMSHTADFTIAGPFGGPAIHGWTEQTRNAQAQVASWFKGGKTEIELVSSHESGDLIVLVMTERGEVKFDGYDKPQPWSLRSTQVYRREGGAWKIVHRHADPLVERRTLSEAIALVSKRETY